PGGRTGRQVAHHVTPHGDDDHGNQVSASLRDATTLVASDTADLDRILARLRLLVIAIFVGAASAAALVMAIVVRQGLRPAAALANRISCLDAQALAGRIELLE